jgi:hypothetical protein
LKRLAMIVRSDGISDPFLTTDYSHWSAIGQRLLTTS